MVATLIRSTLPASVALVGLVGCDCGAATHVSDAGPGIDGGRGVDAAAATDASGRCTPVPWTLSPVDEAFPANDAVLALDEAGRVHFAYAAETGGGGGEIRYAVGAPGAWEIATIHSDATDAFGDAPVDLAVDGSSAPHVAFRAQRGGDETLVYARREPDGSWTTTDIEGLGGDPALAFDAAGVVHVAYVYFSGWQLHHARREPDGSWTISMLDVENPGRWPALAADAAGALHLVYSSGGSLYLASAFTDAWAPAVVDAGGGRTSLALDGAGGVHLVYGDPARSPAGVLHGYLAPGGAWSRSPIDPGDDAVFFLGDLALDAGGGAHLIYTRTEPGVGMPSLRYGNRPLAGTWTTEEVFAASPGRTRSIAVDARGGVHVALFGGSGVQYAYMLRCAPAP